MRLAFFTLLLLHCSLWAQAAKTTPKIELNFEVEKYQLSNGLTILLYEDHSIPMISYHTWFNVGSKDEQRGYTGLAHFLEHLMFKGAKRYTGKQFDRILQANGATNNAFTSFDYTGYYINFPSSKLELMMDIESDRMENLKLDPKDFKSEKEVVREERRYRVDNNPQGALREALYRTVFKVHPYSWPVIGFMKDLERAPRKKVREFWKTYYAPNNAVIVVAGDFEKSKVKSLIKKYYSHIKPKKIAEKKWNYDREQQGQRNNRLVRDVQNPYVMVGFKSAKAGDEDAFALDLLANILGEGSSSRLYKRVVYREQLASSIYAYNYTPAHPGVLQFFMSMKPGADMEKAVQSLYGEIWKVRNREVSEKELEKAKTQVIKGYVDSLTTIHGKAQAFALNEILFKDYRVLFTDLEKYRNVTVKQIKEVANKYLQPKHRSIVRLMPRAGGQQ